MLQCSRNNKNTTHHSSTTLFNECNRTVLHVSIPRCILKVLYEFPNDDSSRIETCSNVQLNLLNRVVSNLCVCVFTAASHYMHQSSVKSSASEFVLVLFGAVLKLNRLSFE